MTEPQRTLRGTVGAPSYVVSSTGTIHQPDCQHAPDDGQKITEAERHKLRDSVSGDPAGHPLCHVCFDMQDDPDDAGPGMMLEAPAEADEDGERDN